MSIRRLMLMSLTNYVRSLIAEFKSRVSTDVGTFISEDCMYSQLDEKQEFINKASIIITPNAFKTSKLYAVKPNDGSSDLTVTRSTAATMIGQDGIITTLTNNVPRLESSCPHILVEPQKTNYITNSDGNLSTYPSTLGTYNAAVPIQGFTNSIQFASQNNRAYKSYTPIVGQRYVFSAFVQMDDNSQPTVGLTMGTGDFCILMNGSIATENLIVQKLGETNIYRVSMSRTAATTGSSFGIVKYTGQSSKSFKTTGFQVEDVTYNIENDPTSYIPTGATSMTRNADFITKTGVSSYIGQTEGSLYCEFASNDSKNWNSGILTLRNYNGSERVHIRFNSSPAQPSGGYLNFTIRSAATFVVNLNTSTICTKGQRYKICCTYNQTEQKIFLDGSLVATRTGSYTQPATMDSIQVGGTISSTFSNVDVYECMVFTTVLTDDEAIKLTTP